MKLPGFFSGFLSIVLIFSITLQGAVFLFHPKPVEAGTFEKLLKPVVGGAAVGLASCGATIGVGFLIERVSSLISVPGTDTAQIASLAKENCMDAVAEAVAQQLLAKLTESTMNWINTGLNGNPFYISDLGSYTESVADTQIKSIVTDLMSGSTQRSSSPNPFSADLARGLVLSHLESKRTTPPDFNLDKIIGDDWKAFSDGDFSKGGWGAWNATTLIPQNNPIGASFAAVNLANESVLKKLDSAKNELLQNEGFLSVKNCVQERDGVSGFGGINNFDISSGIKECLRYETQTPGSIISTQLKKISLLGQEQLQNTDNPVGAMINGVFTGLITNLINKGVSSLTTSAAVANAGNTLSGYGVNSTTTNATSGGNWINAGTQQGIVLEDLDQYLKTQNDYISASRDLINKINTWTLYINKADFCVPGPRPDWYEGAQEQLNYVLDKLPAGSSKNGLFNNKAEDVYDWLLNTLGIKIVTPKESDIHPQNIRQILIRSLDGGVFNGFPKAKVGGYREYISRKFSPQTQIPIAGAINLEYAEKGVYSAIATNALERINTATSVAGSTSYIISLFKALPPKTDPDYFSKRTDVQTKAENLIYSKFKESDIEAIRLQIVELDYKIEYLTAPVNGLIVTCEQQVLTIPEVNRGRRPYPANLLPPGTNYPLTPVFPAGSDWTNIITAFGYPTNHPHPSVWTTFFPRTDAGSFWVIIGPSVWPAVGSQAYYTQVFILVSDYYEIISPAPVYFLEDLFEIY